MEAARENGLLVGKGGLYGNVHPHLAADEHRPRATWTSSSDCSTRAWPPCARRPRGSAQVIPAQISSVSPTSIRPFDSQSAVVEANRCLFCFDAPCTAACPTHIDVPRFIKKIATGNLRGSAPTILDANILGLSCSRVCPVDVLCEGACVMHRYNKKPIEIGRLQRYAMEHCHAASGSPPRRAPRRTSKSPASAAVRRRWPARRNCAGTAPASRSSTTARCPAG